MNHLGLLWAHLKRLMLLFCLIGLQALIAPNMAQAETAAYPGPVLKRLFDLSRAHLPPRIREMAEIGEIALAQIEPGPILQRLYALATTEAGIAEPPVSTGLVQVLQESELSLKKVACRSRANVWVSARANKASASSSDRPRALDFDQIRRTEVGDHGSAACVIHCLTGAGNASKVSIGFPLRRLRRRLVLPRLRVMLWPKTRSADGQSATLLQNDSSATWSYRPPESYIKP